MRRTAGHDAVARTIPRRVVTPLIIAVLLFAVPLSWLIVRDARMHGIELVERRAASVAIWASDPSIGVASAAGVLPALPGYPHERSAIVTRDDPARDLPPEVDQLTSHRTVARAFNGDVNATHDHNLGLFIGAAPIIVEADPIGVALVTFPTTVVRSRLLWPLAVIGVAVVLLIATAVFAARRLSSSIVRQIEALDAAADRFARGELSTRVSIAGPTELRRLAKRLNDSASQLDQTLTAQRNFVSDASHQLRNPLTALRLQLENLALASPSGSTAYHLLRDVDRLAKIVNDLLALARIDGSKLDVEVVDVAEVVSARIKQWNAEELASNPNNGVLTDDRAMVVADALNPASACALSVAGGCEQILDNLVDNARRAAPTSEIVLSIRQRDDMIVCQVHDRGPGLDSTARVQAFTRFWRGSTTDATPGSGLGLPIARGLAAASGGTVELVERPGGGLTAELSLPHARQPGAKDETGLHAVTL